MKVRAIAQSLARSATTIGAVVRNRRTGRAGIGIDGRCAREREASATGRALRSRAALIVRADEATDLASVRIEARDRIGGGRAGARAFTRRPAEARRVRKALLASAASCVRARLAVLEAVVRNRLSRAWSPRRRRARVATRCFDVERSVVLRRAGNQNEERDHEETHTNEDSVTSCTRRRSSRGRRRSLGSRACR